VNEEKVKPTAVVGVDGAHSVNSFKKVIHLYFFPNRLYQPAIIAVDQIDTDNGYLSIQPGQAGGLNINIGVEYLSVTPLTDLHYPIRLPYNSLCPLSSSPKTYYSRVRCIFVFSEALMRFPTLYYSILR